MNSISQILSYLPARVIGAIEALDYKVDITEIRFCINKPVLICRLSQVSCLKDKFGKIITSDKDSFEYMLSCLTGGSLYSVSESIRTGYVTVKGGHRVGVCGTGILSGGRLRSVKDISSLCFRVAKEVRGCSEKLAYEAADNGRILNCLVASPPGFGKTTILRDLCRYLADGYLTGDIMRVGIADERCEIAAVWGGNQQFDTGIGSFVCSGYPKSTAMSIMLRTMSPDVIVTDEIGSGEDFLALREAVRCGVSVIASVHAWSIADLKERFGKDIRSFDKIFFIKNKTSDFKMYRRCNDDY